MVDLGATLSRSKPPGVEEDLQRYDYTLRLFWNNRIYRWVVAQKVEGKMFPVEPALKGCAEITGARTPYKRMIVCEMDPPDRSRVPPGEGIPIVPSSGWIIPILHELCPPGHDKARVDQDDAHEARRKSESMKYLDERESHLAAELATYSEVSGRARKSIIVPGE